MDELRRQILHEIMKIYGPNQGQSIGAVIVPAFMGDFKKVLDDTESADEVSEEYMTEDKRIHLILKGRKTFGRRGNKYYVTDCNFNGCSLACEHVEL